ncbi:MAG TPA: GNAT family protein [Thermoanaerobaculia bacterium]|nr:GNAT family protein [Thermoanaerobaculia bacterium]
MTLEPVVLEGQHVRLEPLSLDHLDDLARVAFDEEIWRWTSERALSADELRAYVERAMAAARTGGALPFATVSRAEGRAIGSTRFANFDASGRRVEIGWTWLGREWQRTAVNTEAKYLMLAHAFEKLGCVRVELRTDVKNERSRAAIRRIGGVEEGVLRKHAITSTGRVRDDVYYSILDDEWPAVRARLEERLALGSGQAVRPG